MTETFLNEMLLASRCLRDAGTRRRHRHPSTIFLDALLNLSRDSFTPRRDLHEVYEGAGRAPAPTSSLHRAVGLTMEHVGGGLEFVAGRVLQARAPGGDVLLDAAP